MYVAHWTKRLAMKWVQLWRQWCQKANSDVRFFRDAWCRLGVPKHKEEIVHHPFLGFHGLVHQCRGWGPWIVHQQPGERHCWIHWHRWVELQYHTQFKLYWHFSVSVNICYVLSINNSSCTLAYKLPRHVSIATGSMHLSFHMMFVLSCLTYASNDCLAIKLETKRMASDW